MYEDIQGYKIDKSQLNIFIAKDFLAAIQLNPFVKLVEIISKLDLDEVIIMDVQVEVPQIPINQIQNIERIAVVFDKLNLSLPKVLALRKNFPQVPHLNLSREETPKDMCLYEESSEEVNLT